MEILNAVLGTAFLITVPLILLISVIRFKKLIDREKLMSKLSDAKALLKKLAGTGAHEFIDKSLPVLFILNLTKSLKEKNIDDPFLWKDSTELRLKFPEIKVYFRVVGKTSDCYVIENFYGEAGTRIKTAFHGDIFEIDKNAEGWEKFVVEKPKF